MRLIGNRHLPDLAEVMVVNVGGPYAELSSPAMNHMGVGGPIVLRGWESRPQGEGGQGIDARRTTSRRSPWESVVSPVHRAAPTKEQPRSRQSLESRMLGNGHVRFGGGSEETELGATAPCSYPTDLSFPLCAFARMFLYPP